MMMLYVNWQDQASRRWYTVGRLSHEKNAYKFLYTRGVLEAEKHGFLPFGNLSDIRKHYTSEELFPLFANRVLPKSRPEYSDYLKWMDIEYTDSNLLNLHILARSGGSRATDNLQIYPAPEKTDEGLFVTYFFVNGIRHLPKESIALIESIGAGAKLFPMHDFANPYDANALTLRTDDPAFLIGYCPRYLSPDLKYLTNFSPSDIGVTVKRVNLDAPIQMRVLCKFESCWPDGFQCQQDECAPLID